MSHSVSPVVCSTAVASASVAASVADVVRRVRHGVLQHVSELLCVGWQAEGSAAPQQQAWSAMPQVVQQAAAFLAQDDFSSAERTFQGGIRSLAAAVPPRAPGFLDWLMLTAFALLSEDSVSADAFLKQADRQQQRLPVDQHPAGALKFAFQVLRSLVMSVAGRMADAEEQLDGAESEAVGEHAAVRMWLVLQLRAAAALQDSRFRAAWQASQAAMLLRRQLSKDTPFAADRQWMSDMASRELAALHN